MWRYEVFVTTARGYNCCRPMYVTAILDTYRSKGLGESEEDADAS